MLHTAFAVRTFLRLLFNQHFGKAPFQLGKMCIEVCERLRLNPFKVQSTKKFIDFYNSMNKNGLQETFPDKKRFFQKLLSEKFLIYCKKGMNLIGKGIVMEQIVLHFGDHLEYMLRMVIAAICGGVIGFERSRRRKEAGLRTHIIVAVGSALLMIVSKYGFLDVLTVPGMRVDASRVAANVITGISFLGAGVIFVRDASIKGLTTAAGLWATAGVGLSIGSGLYSVGIFATALLIVIQTFTRGNLQKLDGPIYETVAITYKDAPQELEQLKAHLRDRRIVIHHIDMEKMEGGAVKVKLEVSREQAITCTDLADMFMKDENIKGFRL